MIKKAECWMFPTIINVYSLLDVANLEEISTNIEETELVNSYHGLFNGKGLRSNTSQFLDSNLTLKSAIQECVDLYSDQLGLHSCTLTYSWCNIYREGSTIKPHRHELSLVSGVFYSKIDDDSGELVFDNPCQPFKVNEISTRVTEYNRQSFRFKISPGDLILFPSWIMHYTENNFSNQRYVVSFDTGLKR
jgi:uncharacterized protein (TIGR02466 family)